jgi:hypothetical protein
MGTDVLLEALSGVPKSDPPPPIGASDGRMYPPLEDNVIRNLNGSITARTLGHRIEISPGGGFKIINKRTGEVELDLSGD